MLGVGLIPMSDSFDTLFAWTTKNDGKEQGLRIRTGDVIHVLPLEFPPHREIKNCRDARLNKLLAKVEQQVIRNPIGINLSILISHGILDRMAESV